MARVVVEEAGVDEHGVRATEDQPHVVVQGDRVVGRLAGKEVAGRDVPLGVLQRGGDG